MVMVMKLMIRVDDDEGRGNDGVTSVCVVAQMEEGAVDGDILWSMRTK